MSTIGLSNQRLVLKTIDQYSCGLLKTILIENNGISFLEIVDSRINKECLYQIIEGLKQNTTINQFSFRFVGTENRELFNELLDELFDEKHQIEYLELSRIPVWDPHIADLLKTNTTLKTLVLKSCDIDKNVSRFIKDALLTNTTLESLDISGNSLYSESVQDLVEIIRHNKTLLELDISGNVLDDNGEGFGLIANALKENSTLLVLKMNKVVNLTDFYDEEYEDSQVSAYTADIIRNNKTLRHLELRSNDIVVFDEISEALQENNTLTTLILSDQSMYLDMSFVTKVVEKNHTLEILGIDEIGSFSEDSLKELLSALEGNETLTSFGEKLEHHYRIFPGSPLAQRRKNLLVDKINEKLETNRSNKLMKSLTLFEILLNHL